VRVPKRSRPNRRRKPGSEPWRARRLAPAGGARATAKRFSPKPLADSLFIPFAPLALKLGLDGKGGVSIGKRNVLFPPRADLPLSSPLSGTPEAQKAPLCLT